MADFPIPQPANDLIQEVEEQSQVTARQDTYRDMRRDMYQDMRRDMYQDMRQDMCRDIYRDIYRDIKDVRLIRSLSVMALVQAFLLVISFITIVYIAVKPAQQIVIERSAEGDRVVAVNGQAVRNGIAVGADRPGAGDKQTLAREWTAARYAVDPLTREKDLEKMFRLMAPHAAKAYSDLLKKQGALERERDERWQALWKPQIVEIDKGDSYRVNVVGIWEITKASKPGNGGIEREVNQLMFALHMIKDTDQGRAPRNAQTGFLIDDILDYRELPVDVSSPTSALKGTQ